jgi:hypothetical protein
MRVVSAAGTVLTERPKVTLSRTLSLGSCAIMAARSRAPASPRELPSQNAVSPRSHSGRAGAMKPSSARSAAATLCSATAVIAVLPTRSRPSPLSGAAATSDASHATLSSGLTSVSHTSGMLAASMSQSGVNVRTRLTAPFSRRASTRNSAAGSSAMRPPRLSRMSPLFIDTPPPLSSRHMPPETVESEMVSKQHICRGPATIGTR